MSFIVGALLLVLFVVILGKLTGRLLGIRLGRWRGALVGAIGWVGGAAAAALAFGTFDDDGASLEVSGFDEWTRTVAVLLFFGVLTAMPAAIGIDLLTRGQARSPRRRGRARRALLHPVRTVETGLAPYARLREVIGHARQANLLHLRYASRSALESPDLSRRVRVVLEDSGGMLVKFGQIASTRTDVLPDSLTEELARLRADVRPVPEAEIRVVLEEELGGPVESAFASFEWEPLAAASIGQTHRAVLLDGTRVVVKVQRPGIGDVVGRDAAVLRLASRQLERRVAAARTIGMGTLTRELIAGVQEELDYGHEAAVGTRLRTRRAADLGVAVPRVYSTLSTDRVLVMEEVIGRSVADQAALDASPVPRAELARRVLASFLGQVLDDGLFHGDPHPGNLLLDDEGTVWMIDFGSVGRLDARAQGGLRGIALGIALGDAGVLARAARDLGGDDGTADLRSLQADLAVQLGELDDGGGLDPRLIGEVLNIMRRHGMRPPGSMTLLARALLTLEGTLKIIQPGFSVQTASKTIVREEHADELGTPQEILQQEALRALPSLRTLPEHAETIANQLRAGRLTIRTEHYAGEDRVAVDSWVDRIVLAVIGGAGTIASAVLLLAAGSLGDDQGDMRVALYILGFAGLTWATILMMRMAARALRRQAGQID